MSAPAVYLRQQIPFASQPFWWVAGRRVELADLSAVPAGSIAIFRGRNYLLTDSQLFIRSRASLDELGAQRLLGQLMRVRVEALVAKYEKVFGVPVARVTIRPMRSRWGSCRPDRRTMTLNLHLVHLADELLEYVVIHEFVHFFARGHGKDFYALLQQHCPDWKTRRQMLNASIGG
ncbi:MAG: M48 family metallopeptidase [Actinomycetaceae bacterium]|nr:M48 family metallopeptidase [Actinomycetaceae bacterium]